jgi:RNA polymerase sigma-70 factor (ECF subfamily)
MENDPSLDTTTIHVRRARRGDALSLAWVVERFSPLLLAQARYRLGPQARGVDPEDVVQDVWATALPRLPELGERDGRSTPVLLRFLSTAVLHQVNNRLRKRAAAAAGGLDEDSPWCALPDETRGPLTRALASESRRRVLAAIDSLSERDRELVVLRGIEQQANDDVAAQLGLTPNTCAQAWHRALERLRERLSGSAFDDLEE